MDNRRATSRIVEQYCKRCRTAMGVKTASASANRNRSRNINRSFRQVNLHAELDLYVGAAAQREQRDRGEPLQRVRADQMRNARFGKKPAPWTQSLVWMGLLKARHGSAAPIGTELLLIGTRRDLRMGTGPEKRCTPLVHRAERNWMLAQEEMATGRLALPGPAVASLQTSHSI